MSATGRENNTSLVFNDQDNWNDAPFMPLLNPGDPMAMRNYLQTYQYDSVGNILQMQHQSAGNNWTRNYVYQSKNNRLISTQVGNEIYQYSHHDRHGFLTALPHLEDMGWGFKEELMRTSSQNVNDGNGSAETTWYQYDGEGKRIRKITENFAAAGTTPTVKEERIYIGLYELYKNYNGSDAGLERVSLSLMDGEHRFVMIDTRNEVDDGTDQHLVRYQLHNYLGSAALELNENAQVISYEEYHPYGTTAYRAKSAIIRASAKRYRYTGMERDEETGLSYHSARYYMPWLGRWLSTDPSGIEANINLYNYADANPVIHVDTDGKDPFILGPPMVVPRKKSPPKEEPAPPPEPQEPSLREKIAADPRAQHTGGFINGILESLLPIPLSQWFPAHTPEYAQGHAEGSAVGLALNVKNVMKKGGGGSAGTGYQPTGNGTAVAMPIAMRLESKVIIGLAKIAHGISTIATDLQTATATAGAGPAPVHQEYSVPNAGPATDGSMMRKGNGNAGSAPKKPTQQAPAKPPDPRYKQAADRSRAEIERMNTPTGKVIRQRYDAQKKFTDPDKFMDFSDYLYDKGPADVNIGGLRGTRKLDERAANKVAGYDKTPEGYTWHHHQDLGRMQLVKNTVHAQKGLDHSGGASIWGEIMGFKYK